MYPYKNSRSPFTPAISSCWCPATFLEISSQRSWPPESPPLQIVWHCHVVHPKQGFQSYAWDPRSFHSFVLENRTSRYALPPDFRTPLRDTLLESPNLPEDTTSSCRCKYLSSWLILKPPHLDIDKQLFVSRVLYACPHLPCRQRHDLHRLIWHRILYRL